MIGRAICDRLLSVDAIGGICVSYPKKYSLDLLSADDCRDALHYFKPDIVIHAAGFNGGISFNAKFPADIFHKTALMALNLYNAVGVYARDEKKPMMITGILASCSYPDLESGYFSEEDLHKGLPNNTVECHGLAKRIIDDFGRQVSKQYGILVNPVVLTNSYGPFDNFNPYKTKVVGSMIRKFVDAKNNNLPSITFWGDGSPKREFIYCKDAGRIIADLACKTYDDVIVNQKTSNLSYSVTNVGSGQEFTIKETAETIAKIVGYTGEILWDTSKPNGQMRKALDISRLKELMPVNFTPFEQAIKETLDWYLEGDNKAVYDNKI